MGHRGDSVVISAIMRATFQGHFLLWVARRRSRADRKERKLNQLHGGKAMSKIIWKCEKNWAGQLYHRMMFDTREEAEEFVSTMQQMEPDQMFSIEAIKGEQVWN
jgi:hypothetical protein